MNSILGKWIKKRNKSDFVVLILLGVMVMIVAMPTGAKQSQKETQMPMRSGMRTLLAGMSVISFVLRSMLM